MKPAPFDYVRPASLAEAISLLASAPEEARAIAGGQSLGPMLNLRLARPQLLVDLRRLPELNGVREEAAGVWLGAATTHSAIEDGRTPDPTRGNLSQIAGAIAYRAVRNRGTIGGSLSHADPAADWVTAMIALGAEILLTGPSGARRVAAADFIRGAFRTDMKSGEVLTAVWIPRLAEGAQFGWCKICRKPGEFATAIGAVLIDPARGLHRSVMGAVSGRPVILDLAQAAEPDRLAEELTKGTAGLDDIDLHVHATALRRAERIAA